ncbi:MAG: pyrroline-5-carboxylate reductase [Clostridia bacterium]|nr:pyrroline-5-carboxylate reductase [Clostridia bacterium]
MNNKKIGFIGEGNMAGAIINGIIKNGSNPCDINVFDVDKSKMDYYKSNSFNTCTDTSSLVNESDIVVFAVKPFHLEEVLNEIKHCDLHNKIFVSIVAGIKMDFISSKTVKDLKIIRVMPNTPMLIGEGASALCKNDFVTDEELNEIVDIFASMGVAKIIKEDKMNEMIAVSGSSPAYVYLFLKSIIDEGVSMGIDESIVKELAVQSFIGSAKMILETDKTPKELIDMVTSPRGTTLEAMNVFYQNNLEKIISDAMKACTKRAIEISEGK